MNLKSLILPIISIIIVNYHALSADIKPDMKFINEATSIVWGHNANQFDAKTIMTDSIYHDSSAIYIAVMDYINAKRVEATPFGIYKGANREYFGETTVDYYTRYMVKLIDSNAIEEFSTHTFRAKTETKAAFGYLLFSSIDAFGARIHKPDGSVIDVDCSTALPETAGKKDKVSKFKIAIPGLEPGDVLEYFQFVRTYYLGDQQVGINFEIFKQYPIASYNFSGTFDKILTTEINTFNGLEPETFKVKYGTERDTIITEFNNIEQFDEPKFSNKYRQIPYFRFKIADNHSRVFGHSKTSRRPGIYTNLTPPVIMAEIAEKYSLRPLPANDPTKTWGLVKTYMKNNPEASWQEIADAAWIATRYVALVSKESYNDWDLISLFKDVIDKAKLPEEARLAVTTSRYAIPINEIAGAQQATPIVIMGDRIYLQDDNLIYCPGELPGKYQGEKAMSFTGSRANIFNDFKLRLDTLPSSQHKDNSESLNIIAQINPDEDHLIDFEYTSTTTGTMKASGSAFLNSKDIIEMSEEYLGVKAKNRSKRKFDLVALDDSRRKALEAMPEIDFSSQDITVDSVSILSPGLLPEYKTFEYRITGNIDGLITNVGDEILIKIGNLVGAAGYSSINRNKPRDLDIYTPSPYNQRYTLTFKVPDEYILDTESLNNLQVNKANLCGSYFVQTTYDQEKNEIKVIANRRNNRTIYPYTMWNEFLDLRDAVSEFGDATLILIPKPQ